MNITLSDIKEAYLQLKRHLYYERLDIEARHKIVEFENSYDFNIDGRLNTINTWIKKYSKADGIGDPVEKLVSKIDVNIYAKKVGKLKDDNTTNFISDRIHSDNFILERESVFISLPTELQIFGCLWLNTIGQRIDNDLIEHCYGNRLIKNNEDHDLKMKGRLFKIYHYEYARWWKTGLNKAKSILREDKEDVVMINFDLKSFYHSVCLDKEELRSRIKYHKIPEKEKYLHRVLESILIRYNERLKELKLTKNIDGLALPLGYLASPILANDYLSKFDKEIFKNVRPSYYGRYVDDILVVFKSGTAIDDYTKKENEDSESVLSELESNRFKEAVDRFLKYLGDRFTISNSNDELKIQLNGIKGAELQMEKLFVYELDKASPSNLIERFIQDQNSKSYEFQFEAEENDGVSGEFGDLIFTQSFEKEEASKAKIKRISQNKFEISVFLSRLIRRSTSSDDYIYSSQMENVISYYKGANCIENWHLWEKIILGTIANNDEKRFLRFIKQCQNSIRVIALDMNSSSSVSFTEESLFKKNLERILELSISNSLAANPKFLELKGVRKNLNNTGLEIPYQIIRSAGFIRNEFTAFPLIGLIEDAIKSTISYFSRGEISTFIEKNPLKFKDHFLSYSPVRVKYWQICHIKWINQLNLLKWKSGPNRIITEIPDELNLKKVQIPAFDIFFAINFSSIKDPDIIRKKYFFKVGDACGNNGEPRKEEINIIASEEQSEIRFGLVNEHVDKKRFEEAAKGKVNLVGRLDTAHRVLDEVKRKKCDLAVQPELSVPFDFLWNYCSYSEKHQIALIAGIEHKRIRNVVFNFIATFLPMKVNGIFNDAIPVLRLKNHYAPKEQEMINGFRATVPKPSIYSYHLFKWKGLYFTNYYCYELANIKHRHIFQGEIDVLIAPVWNPDTNYYNGIVETSAREIHCVFSQVNTSEYGDTRWTIPAKTELKNPLRVKGGTTKDNPFTIALSVFKPNELREFQNLAYIAQKKNGRFKPTPPDYPNDKAVKRIDQESFYINE